MGVYDDGAVTITESNRLLNDPNCEFTFVGKERLEIHGADNLCLITDLNDEVYMITFTSTDNESKDWADLWKVDLARKTDKRFTLLKSRQMYTKLRGGIIPDRFGPHFRYGAGLQILSKSELEFFCCERNPILHLDINNFVPASASGSNRASATAVTSKRRENPD